VTHNDDDKEQRGGESIAAKISTNKLSTLSSTNAVIGVTWVQSRTMLSLGLSLVVQSRKSPNGAITNRNLDEICKKKREMGGMLYCKVPEEQRERESNC